ncbi:Asp23/Gls24 family envelope stress response protein [Amycolatopsis sp. H20-H5]|uniref:Asp23/Gls24 family envelope stress response protein n=1 Tax=Amycolatopsis sp. H20-H5 TaxID=3046309 RepID=UPI002DB92828|nr:Asp23/Gls24 family envelope stress response protein [Amycolatopsis sp. H20-H5]MEC3975643.1 Asp23/Gls24 family envelope stress response protein [Amycolatopsis sp. H20-H5]
MTTTYAPPAGRHRADEVEQGEESGDHVETESDRGRTTLEPRAVKKIAARAAGEVDGVGEGAKVSARVDGETATLDVQLPVSYPASVARTTEAVRAHLMRRTHQLTGLTVPRVDIVVSALKSAEVRSGRVW